MRILRLVNERVLVPFGDPIPLLVCPLLQSMFQLIALPSGSFIGILQVKLSGWLVEPFPGVGVPKVGGLLLQVVKVYHARVQSYPSVTFTHTLYGDA